jgi:hypothetical protein
MLSRLPDHLYCKLAALALIALIWAGALVHAIPALCADPVEDVQFVHAGNHRPVILHVRDQLDVESFVYGAMGVELHDVFGAAD